MLPQEDGAWVEQVMAAKRSTTLGDAIADLERLSSDEDLEAATAVGALLQAAVPTDGTFMTHQVSLAVFRLAADLLAIHLATDYETMPLNAN
jgi:hypothetical protein